MIGGVTTPADSFYEPLGSTGSGEHFRPTAATAGPWSPSAQHGGPPAALLARAIERLDEGAPRQVGRFTMDLLGPVPVAEVSVRATVLRPGRSVSLRQAEIADAAGRVVARAQAWTFPVAAGGAGADGSGRSGGSGSPGGAPGGPPGPLAHGPLAGRHEEPPSSWSRGYLDAIEWRWIEGAITRPGQATVWMRPLVPLVPDETMSPLQRLLSCVDSASGASAVLDTARWNFLNTELSVHVLRPLVGEWVCLDAETVIGPGAVGLATSSAYDETGLVARSAQALLVSPREE